MTERKWTPGPWEAMDKGFHPYPYVCGPEDDYEYGKDRPVVAYLVGMNIPHNAHLIAAAPDLYEALEWCIKSLEFSYTGTASDSEIPQDIRAALAKARGEL